MQQLSGASSCKTWDGGEMLSAREVKFVEKLGVKVVQFTKVKGQDPPPGATAQMAA